MIRPILFLAVALAVAGAAAQQRVDVIGGSRPAEPNRPPQRDLAREQEHVRQAAPAQGVQPPVPLSNCNAGGCWDSQGNRYNATGDGSRLLNSDGRLCTANGKFITCN